MCPIDPARYRAVREARGLPGPLAGPSGWPRSRPKPENGPRTTSYGSRPGEAAPGYHIDERFDRRGARVPGSGTRAPGRVGRAPGADPGRPQLNKTIKLLFPVIFLVSPAIFNRFFTRFRSTPRFSPRRLLVVIRDGQTHRAGVRGSRQSRPHARVELERPPRDRGRRQDRQGECRSAGSARLRPEATRLCELRHRSERFGQRQRRVRALPHGRPRPTPTRSSD